MRFFHSPTAVFLEEFEGHDLFYDNPTGLPTLVARFGGSTTDYRSGLFWAEFDPQLVRAKELAFEKGLINEAEIEEATDIDDEIASCPHCAVMEDFGEGDSICQYHMDALEEHFDCIHGWEEDAEVHSACMH